MSYDLLRHSGRIVSFSTVATALLPTEYIGVEVVAIAGYTIAIGIEDITAKYKQLEPYIEGISSDFTKAEYVIIKTANGDLEVLALAWIVESSISTTEVANKRITIYNVDSTANIKLTKVLNNLGYTNFVIEDI